MKRMKWLGATGVALVLSSAGIAQAGNVYWSIGVHQPGVHVGVSNTPPVVVAPPVVVYPPRHVVVTQPPVVVVPPPHAGWVPPGHRKHLHHAGPGQSHKRGVTQVHHHHYYGATPVVYAQPPRPWR